MSEPKRSRSWGILALRNGMSGRGDWDASTLKTALDAGWEPFAVADGHVWLKKQDDAEESTDAAEIARLRAALEWLLPRQAAPGCIDVIMDALRLQ